MRKVIYGINLTLDGCCDHTKGRSGADIHEYFTQRMQEADLIVYGRKTYELMVPYWPGVAKSRSGSETEHAFARAFSAIDNIVFSRTLTTVEDKNTRLLHGNLEEEIRKLKQQPGGNISVGGVDLPAQLITLGLVDEFHFVIHPVMAGSGRRLPGVYGTQELQLITSAVLPSGCVALHYRKQ